MATEIQVKAHQGQMQVLKKLEEQQLTHLQHLGTKEVCREVSKQDRDIIHAASAYPMLVNIPDEEQEDAFRTALSYIIVACSIKTENMPSPMQINVMLQYFRNHFRTITMEELKLSVDLNFARDEEEKVKHFQCIDIEFLSSLITKYRYDRMKAFTEINKVVAVPVEKQLNAPKASLQSLIGWYKEKGEMPLTYDWVEVFEQMRVEKKCEPFEVMKQWMEPEERKIRSEINMRLKTCANIFEKRNIELSLTKDAIRAELRKRYVLKRIPELCESTPSTTTG